MWISKWHSVWLDALIVEVWGMPKRVPLPLFQQTDYFPLIIISSQEISIRVDIEIYYDISFTIARNANISVATCKHTMSLSNWTAQMYYELIVTDRMKNMLYFYTNHTRLNRKTESTETAVKRINWMFLFGLQFYFVIESHKIISRTISHKKWNCWYFWQLEYQRKLYNNPLIMCNCSSNLLW